jgi:hypothetical protein
MLARQVAFATTGVSAHALDLEVPREIFGRNRVMIRAGDGWGFIHRHVAEEALGALSEACRRTLILRYFEAPISPVMRSLPDGVLVFRRDFDANLAREENRSAATTLRELRTRYGQGWRFDGRNDDLGPVNGPFPLQELVKACYVYTALIVERLTQNER